MHIEIVGASLSGAYLALLLRDKGFQISIFDHRVPWEKPCGGGINREPLCSFPIIEKLPCKWHKPTGFKIISSTQEKTLPLEGESPWLITARYALSRSLLDLLLKENSIKLIKKYVKKILILPNGNFIEIKTTDNTVNADVIIGADGANSVVRKHLIGSIPKKISELLLVICYQTFH